MNLKYSLTLIISCLFIISCGGGGGGGSSAPTPVGGSTGGSSGGSSGGGTTYSYDPIAGSYSNKSWDSIGTGIVAEELEAGNYTWNGNTIFLSDFLDRSKTAFSGYDNYNLDVEATQVSDDEFNIAFSGITDNSENPTINLNLNFNAWNQDRIDLYEYGKTEPSFTLGTATFSDAVVSFFGPYDEYLQEQGLDYVTGYQLIVGTVEETYLLPIIAGDFTETGDMPSGSTSKSFETISYYYEDDYDVPYEETIAVTGEGEIDFNHTNNTLSGTMTFSIFMDLDEFLNGNGLNAQYTSISEQTISITNGQIVGNQFSADLSVSNSDITMSGKLIGAFFGPNASEFGASYFLVDTNNIESDFNLAGGYLLGE